MTPDEYVKRFAQQSARRNIRIMFGSLSFEPKFILGVSPTYLPANTVEEEIDEVQMINEWCREHCFGKVERLSVMFDWAFDNEKDAAIFKLTWG